MLADVDRVFCVAWVDKISTTRIDDSTDCHDTVVVFFSLSDLYSLESDLCSLWVSGEHHGNLILDIWTAE